LLGAWNEVARGTDAGWAAGFTGAALDQFARLADEQVVRAEERLGKTDAAGIGVVEIEIRLKEFGRLALGKFSHIRQHKIVFIDTTSK